MRKVAMNPRVLYQQSESLTKRITVTLTGNALLMRYSSLFRKLVYTVTLEAIHPIPQICKEGYNRYWYYLSLVVLLCIIGTGSSFISLATSPEEKTVYLSLILLSVIAILAVWLKMVINGKKYLLFVNHNKDRALFKLRYKVKEQSQIEQLIHDLTHLQPQAIENRIDKDTKKLKEGIDTLFQRKILNKDQYSELIARISIQKSSLLE
jgi:hypothetical protein